MRPHQRTPDLTPEIMASVGVHIPTTAVRRVARWTLRDHPWRAALVVVAIAQLALGVGQVLEWGSAFGGHDHGAVSGSGAMSDSGGMNDSAAMSGHLFNESTAWNLAVGVGFLVVAARPRATAGLLPVLAAFTGVLGVFVVTDTIAGQVTLARIASHAIIAVGVLVVTMVHRGDGRRDAPPPIRAFLVDPVEVELPPGARRGRRHGHLRDASGPAA